MKDLEVILPSVAERLKPLRKSRGLTQMEMGKLLNCTDRHYQKVNLPATTLIFLADFFHVTTDYLLGRD